MSRKTARNAVAVALTLGLSFGLTAATTGVSQAEPEKDRVAVKEERRAERKPVRNATKRPPRTATRNDNPNTSYTNVTIREIATNVQSDIDELVVRGAGTESLIAGCGAKLAALPHLLHHYETQTPVAELVVRDGCLARVVTSKR